MDYNIALLGIFSGIAEAACFFIAYYFFFIKKKDSFKNNLLGFLFVAIGFRIGKSIAYFIFIDIISIGLAIGYIGLASIGPLIYLYMRSVREEETKLFKLDILHFIIPFLGVFVCFFTHLGHITNLYRGVTAMLFIYLIIAFKNHIQSDYKGEDVKQWNTILLIVVSIIWMCFVSQHLTPSIMKYAIGTGIASLAIYSIFIYALKSTVVFNKPKGIKIPNDTIKKVKNAFEKDQIYLKQAITLNEFAKDQEIPSYLVTEAVKKLYGKRFPEVVNYFRIEDIKQTLIKENNSKIEALAYEFGFNTPSTFYAAFKRETNMSPKEFQKSMFYKINNN